MQSNLTDTGVDLAVDILTALNRVSHVGWEHEVERVLERIGTTIGLDWVTFWDSHPATSNFLRVATWRRPQDSAAPLPVMNGEIEAARVMTALQPDADGLIEVSDINALDPDHALHMLGLDASGFAVLIGVQHHEGTFDEALVFGSRRARTWTSEDRSLCRLFAQALDSLVLRVRAESRAVRQQTLYRDYIANVDTAVWCTRFDPPIDFDEPIEDVARALVHSPYVEANPAFCRARGHDNPAEVIGKTWLELYARDDPRALDRYLRFLKEYLHQDSYLFESATDNRIYKVYIYREIIDGKTCHIWGTMTDVTELEGARRELAASEQRLKSWIDHSEDLIACVEYPRIEGFDTPPALPQDMIAGRVVECTDNYARAYGYPSRSAMIGQPLDSSRSPFHQAQVGRTVARFFQSGFADVEDVVERIRDVDEPRFYHLRMQGVSKNDATNLQVWMTMKDRTREVNAQRELESSERLRTLAMNAADLHIWGFSAAEGLDLGASAKQLLGFEKADRVRVSNVRAVCDAEDEPAYTAAMSRFEREDVPSMHGEYRMLVNGKQKVIEIWGNALRRDRDQGQLLQAAGVLRDVTEMRRMERRMLDRQKLESLGVLAGGIAHDFNNLLMSIAGNAELGRDDVGDQSPTHHALTEIERAAHRAAELCEQLLAYAGESVPRREASDLVQLVDELARLLGVSVSKQTNIVINHAAKALGINADPAQVGQVIMNLIVNASEALGEQGGTVTINTSLIDPHKASTQEDPDLLQPLPAGTWAVLEVSDNGRGMSKAVRERMFDPFFSTKFPGRGLGMASVLGIINAHDGGISVRSDEENGTRIRVYLPLIELPALTGATPDAAPSPVINGRVLIVDDEAMILDVANRMMRRMGFETLTATTGEAALEQFDEQGPTIGLVLLDLSMPGMGGAATARAIRDRHPHVPILLSSGYASDGIPEDLLERGIQFIHKPYTTDAMRDVLANLVGP